MLQNEPLNYQRDQTMDNFKPMALASIKSSYLYKLGHSHSSSGVSHSDQEHVWCSQWQSVTI